VIQRLRRLVPNREALLRNRWLRWLGPSLLHPRLWHFSRRGVATGSAVGVFFAIITPVAQIPLSAAASVVLRCNIPSAVVATLVNTPPTFAPVYYGAWKIGSWVLGTPQEARDTPHVLSEIERNPTGTRPAAHAGQEAQGTHATLWHTWMQRLQRVGKPLFVGAMILAVVSSALAYVSVNAIWHLRVRLKRRRRRR
jgi:uncharacterized protein